MSKKIFRSVWLAALVVLALSLVLIMGVLYSYFTGVKQKQLRTGTEAIAQGVTLNGIKYFDGLPAGDYRITWIDADGTVLYDNENDVETMESHLAREEVQVGQSIPHLHSTYDRLVVVQPVAHLGGVAVDLMPISEGILNIVQQLHQFLLRLLIDLHSIHLRYVP